MTILDFITTLNFIRTNNDESHPPFYRMVEHLKKVEKLSQKLSIELETGLLKRKKAKYVQISDRLNNIMDDFDPADRLKTLNKIACITKLDVRVERVQIRRYVPDKQHA